MRLGGAPDAASGRTPRTAHWPGGRPQRGGRPGEQANGKARAAPWPFFFGDEGDMTRGQLEDAVSKTLVRYEREYAGHGPVEARTYLLDDMVVVRLQGVLTVMEKTLIADSKGGWNTYLVKQLRTEWIEKIRGQLTAELAETIGTQIVSLHEDVSTQSGESVFVFVLAQKRN
jgi:uncharacterized protein YbcI